MNFRNPLKFGRPSVMQMVFIVFGLLLAVGSFFLVRNFVVCFRITDLPGRVPPSCGTLTHESGFTLNEEGTPVPDEAELPPPAPILEGDLPPAWDGASRITVLVIGLDYRDWTAGQGPPRSDTMILLTIDPLTKTAGMLSIPRDMWVNIPNHGYDRINMAYYYGEADRLPGGGPELARKTVEQFIGVPIHYYAQVDFGTFVEFIDLIGGIDIHNDETLRLDQVGSGRDKIKLTCCGIRHLRGDVALAYVRYRKDKEGDVKRAERQQKVVLAIRNKVLSPENFPMLVGNAQQFYERFSAGVNTNMPFDTALRLGILAKDIPLESIEQGVMNFDMMAPIDTEVNGVKASILKPFPDKIRELRDEIFTTAGALNPLAAQNDLGALMREEAARVRVTNASATGGLETRTRDYLASQGVQVTEYGPPASLADGTVIVLYSPKLYTLKYLQTVFGITAHTQILIQPDPAASVDVEVRLGNDWASRAP
jgi:LCP family protein required for cell wall assembly